MIKKLLFILIPVVLSISCNTKVPAFEIYQEVRFTLPAGKIPTVTHHFLVHDIPSFLKENLKTRGLTIDDITEFYAGKGRFISLDYDYNFGILYDVSVWIYKINEYNNRKEIYYRDEVPINQKGELKLLSTGEDVRDILLSDKYEMDIELVFINTSNITTECALEFNYVAFVE